VTGNPALPATSTGGLVYLATGKPTTALLGVAAWKILLVGAGLIYSIGRLFGYDRLWTWHPQVPPDITRIDAQLRAKGNPFLMPLRHESEITCVVWDPAGQETRVSNV
jgi:membrane protein DedA with SNARE-associated domain